MKFVDEVDLVVASGKGGAGCVSFRREAMVPRGGPDGGDGGRGGDVIFEVDSQLHSLLDLRLRRQYRAGDGQPGRGQNCNGLDGNDLLLRVPPGTVVRDRDGHVLADLTEGRVIFLKGGLGGKGNSFYKSSVNQAPTVAQKGLPGQEMAIRLELKLIADVGIIGYPNAGKSTLIARISAARPRIADYPFTTLVPQLGVVRFGDDRTFVVADIPGLIPGAHQGVGLGIQFLRHVERTRLFVHLVDASGMSGRDPYQDYLDIMHELKMYDSAQGDDFSEEAGRIRLEGRPMIIVLNKTDVVEKDSLEEMIGQFRSAGLQVLAISAATGQGVRDLVFQMGQKVFAADDGKEEE